MKFLCYLECPRVFFLKYFSLLISYLIPDPKKIYTFFYLDFYFLKAEQDAIEIIGRNIFFHSIPVLIPTLFQK